MPHPRSLLLNGLSRTLSRFPALLWTYVFNLTLAVLFSLHMHSQLAAITAHSLAAQRLSSGFDLGTTSEVFVRLSDTPGTLTPSFAVLPLYFLLYFVIVPGTLFCYLTGTPAHLGTLLQQGLAHFWRFIRITLLTLLLSAAVLGPLLAIQSVFAAHVDRNAVGRFAFLHYVVSFTLIGLVAAVLRLYFDLVEVYTVQLGHLRYANGKPDRRVRHTLLPAFRTLRQNFLRAYLTFLTLALLGIAAVYFTARTAMHQLAQPRVWTMVLLAQLGLFVMLLTRFWQRGAAATLALDFPLPRIPLSPTAPLKEANMPLPEPPPPTPDNTPHPIPDPIPDPEPAPPSLDNPDPGVFHHTPHPPAE